MTLDDVAAQLHAAGLRAEAVDTSGRLVRCPVDSDKGSKRSGWYVIHEHQGDDGTYRYCGAFGNHKAGAEVVNLRLDWRGMGDADRAALKAQQRAARAAAETEQAERGHEAARRAAAIWAKLPEVGSSAYLQRKGVSGHGVRFAKGSVVVPLRSGRGRLRGLQWIAADGTKRFLTGTRKRGAMHVIGDDDPEALALPVLIAEGYSTAAACYEATGWRTVVAFDAGNLEPVAGAVRARWPDAELLICADDDAQTRDQKGDPHNTGIIKAQAAARAHGAGVALPIPAIYANVQQAGTEGLRLNAAPGVLPDGREAADWCDVAGTHGLQVVRAMITADWHLMAAAAKDQPVRAIAAPAADQWREAAALATRDWKRATQRGIELILANDGRWAGVFARDLFSEQLVKKRPPPFEHGAEAGDWTDRDSAHCISWLSEHYGLEPGPAILSQALQVVADREAYHPVREWLDGLDDTGTQLLEVWLREALGCSEDADYLAAVGRAWLISAVARVMEPGCKADHVLILEGPQGLGKSTALMALFAPWFSDQPIIFQDKDSYLALRGVWMLEFAELDSWRKAEHTQSKAYISQRVDRYRPPYGHRMQQVPRQVVFAGTTNQREYLRDPTGHRRYWPVTCSCIDLEFIEEQRGALFAEALREYRAGAQWWLTPEQELIATAARDRRIQEDPWEESIGRWLEGRRGRISTETILMGALSLDRHSITQQHQTRVAYVMLQLRWRKARWREGAVQVRGYEREATGDE